MQLKESQDDIRKMKEAIIETKSKLFQAELQQVENQGNKLLLFGSVMDKAANLLFTIFIENSCKILYLK